MTISIIDAEEIKNHFKKIKEAINAKNLTLAIVASIEFGEYLREKFPDKTLEEIQKQLEPQKENFKDEPMPVMLIPAVIFEAKTAVFMRKAEGADKNTKLALDNLSKGINCFNYLLDSNECEKALKAVNFDDIDRLQPEAEKFIEKDLIPNTPARIQLNNTIKDIAKLAHDNNGDIKIKAPLDNLAKNLQNSSSAYYGTPDKSKAKTEKFKSTCNLRSKAADKKMQGLQVPNWKAIFNKILIAISAIGTSVLSLIPKAIRDKYKTGEKSFFESDRTKNEKVEKISQQKNIDINSEQEESVKGIQPPTPSSSII